MSKQLLRNINTKLCELEGTDTTGIISKLEEILQELKDTPQLESLSPVSICDSTGIIGFQAFVLDEETGIVTTLYYNPDGTPSIIPIVGEVCGVAIDYEFKFFEELKCTKTETVKEVLCIVYENGIEVSTETFWIVNGTKVTIEPIGIIPCIDCPEKGSQGTVLNWNQLK